MVQSLVKCFPHQPFVCSYKLDRFYTFKIYLQNSFLVQWLEKCFPHQPFKYSYKLDRFTLSQKYLCIFKMVYLFWFYDCWNFVRRCHVTISVEEEDSHAKTGRPALSIIRNRLNKTFPTCFLHGHLALTHFKRCQKWPQISILLHFNQGRV